MVKMQRRQAAVFMAFLMTAAVSPLQAQQSQSIDPDRLALTEVYKAIQLTSAGGWSCTFTVGTNKYYDELVELSSNGRVLSGYMLDRLGPDSALRDLIDLDGFSANSNLVLVDYYAGTAGTSSWYGDELLYVFRIHDQKIEKVLAVKIYEVTGTAQGVTKTKWQYRVDSAAKTITITDAQGNQKVFAWDDTAHSFRQQN